MKPIKVTVPKKMWFVPRPSTAITLFPFIFTREGAEEDPALAAHELHHWYEIKRGGVVIWYLAYLLLLPVYGGGRNHPMEKMAYSVQDAINKEKSE